MIARAENPDGEREGENSSEPAAGGSDSAAVPPVALSENFRAGSGQTSDTRMIERAIRERWPISPAVRDAAVKRMATIAIDPNSSKREATSAFRSLVSADALNMADEHKQIPDMHVHGVTVRNGEASDVLVSAILARIAAGESVETVLGDVIDEPNG